VGIEPKAAWEDGKRDGENFFSIEKKFFFIQKIKFCATRYSRLDRSYDL